jgi:hypothetical protein
MSRLFAWIERSFIYVAAVTGLGILAVIAMRFHA